MERFKCNKCGQIIGNDSPKISQDLHSGLGIDETVFYHFACWKKANPDKYERIDLYKDKCEHCGTPTILSNEPNNECKYCSHE